MVLKAKCPDCKEKAELDDDMTRVKCNYCGFHVSYDEYIEIMKDRAFGITDDYQRNLDKESF